MTLSEEIYRKGIKSFTPFCGVPTPIALVPSQLSEGPDFPAFGNVLLTIVLRRPGDALNRLKPAPNLTMNPGHGLLWIHLFQSSGFVIYRSQVRRLQLMTPNAEHPHSHFRPSCKAGNGESEITDGAMKPASAVRAATPPRIQNMED